MKKVAKEKVEGKAKEEREGACGEENKITRSLAPFPSISFLLSAG